MSIFDKCDGYTLAHETQAAGLYPYFHPIEEATATEARIRGEWKVMVGSNNYLGLTHHPRVLEAAASALTNYGSGSTGSRFLNGTLDLHYELEERLARFFHKEAALVFTTGYQASLGATASIVARGDHLFLDRLDHASLVDGARLSHGEVHRYPHGDFAALGKQLARIENGAGKLVVSDGVFSMEGSIVDLPALVRVAKAHGAQVMIDEAHAVGVLGPDGAGTVSHFGLADEVDLILATFSKSLASVGGVIAGPECVIHWLRHHSRALIFTASMPPSSVAGALAALDVLEQEPERRERLWANTNLVAQSLRSMGFDTGESDTPVIPVLIGDFEKVLVAWRTLFDHGVFTHPIVPPAVPLNACRIRVSMSAEHTDEQIERVLSAFEHLARTTVLV
ncbi:MAG TPA: aminotransferase class I/II-fold pyridoxal phosphate-dependent enzyme [Gemmatimonadaceae bacterium]|jgi:8-amino-7-oxononanoate synthase|nr:aminotransferase class I/II-fold pyridoxal phosphate-dependent enzyme [Gemmatimonadaceae bacterium]